jgi:glucokinase
MTSGAIRAGVDVGGTNVRVGVVRHRELIWSQRFSADFAGLCQSHPPRVALERIQSELLDALRQAITQHPDISAVGIGFPGFIDPQSQIVQMSPNLPRLVDVDIAGPLEQKLGIPVHLVNDAMAAAYGEFMLAEPKLESLIYVGLGTGVGGGLIIHGNPYRGEHGVGMEIGHLTIHPEGRLCGCGNRGCLEQYASATGLAITYRELAHENLDAEAIVHRSQSGDRHALTAVKMAAESLAMAVSHLVKILDVSRVVMGGGMSKSWLHFQSFFDTRLDALLIPSLRGRIQVEPSRLEDRAGVIGAACLSQG